MTNFWGKFGRETDCLNGQLKLVAIMPLLDCWCPLSSRKQAVADSTLNEYSQPKAAVGVPPYSGSGFDLRNSYLEQDCGITAGTRPLPYSDSGSIYQIKRLEALLDIFAGISAAKASLLVVLLALGLGASINTELDSHPLRQILP